MPKKRHSPEEIVAKLRQVDVMTSQGRTLGEAIRVHASAGVGRPVSPLAWLARSVPQTLGGSR